MRDVELAAANALRVIRRPTETIETHVGCMELQTRAVTQNFSAGRNQLIVCAVRQTTLARSRQRPDNTR